MLCASSFPKDPPMAPGWIPCPWPCPATPVAVKRQVPLQLSPMAAQRSVPLAPFPSADGGGVCGPIDEAPTGRVLSCLGGGREEAMHRPLPAITLEQLVATPPSSEVVTLHFFSPRNVEPLFLSRDD